MADNPANADAAFPNHAARPGAISAEPMHMPPISLDAPPPRRPTAPAIAAKKEPDVKDTFRELIETIVFVVVLVLMLKTFLAEAFVIPTGSMADTLLGYHHKVACAQCGYSNLFNASDEAEPKGPQLNPVVTGQCGNCGFVNQLSAPRVQGGQQ
jgi:signal peptidase I